MDLYINEQNIEVGVDEAGRGCLCGPVFAAAVILPHEFSDDKYLEIKDSKKLSRKKRAELRKYIENNAIDYGVASASSEEIDNINILNASHLAMHRALDSLGTEMDEILVDGDKFKHYLRNDEWVSHRCIPKGDDKYYSIAAASILAKEYHDDFILKMDEDHPEYDWINNRGYGTKSHIAALRNNGVTNYHRKTFNICKQLC